MYDTRTSRHFVWMVWFILAAAFVIGGIYLIGQAASDAAKANHQRQIECLQAGGEMERIHGNSGIYCNKDD